MMALAYCSGVTVKVMSVSVQAVQLKQGMNLALRVAFLRSMAHHEALANRTQFSICATTSFEQQCNDEEGNVMQRKWKF
jgi:hypothetical protein